MAWFEDSAPCEYFGRGEAASSLLSVGWLEGGRDNTKGAIKPEEFDKLLALLVDAWQPVCAVGVHLCDLCQHSSEQGAATNLFIPGAGFIYVAPALITHYINAHWYKPPQGFLDAAMECPEMRSMAYRRALLANGGRALLKNAG